MAQVNPFRALRFSPSRVPLAKVATQPYDKISPEMQEQYREMKIAGKRTSTFTVAGAFPNRPTMYESFKSLNAEGGGQRVEQQNADDPLNLFGPKASAGANAGQIINANIGGRQVTVSSDIADRLARVDAELFAATGQHLQINQSYRTSAQQADLYRKSQAGLIGRAAPPGKSFHEKGLAVDVTNWQAAQPYLRKYGLLNNLPDDRGHFSWGEWSA